MANPLLSADPVPDAALLSAWLAGDDQAFSVLVERHRPLVVQACKRQAGSADADDAAQAVFLVLARKGAEASANGSLIAWLLTVTRHVCATIRRGRARRQRAEHEAAMPPDASTPSPSPSDALVLLDEVLANLPERERVAVSLHYLAGQPQAAIANELLCPVNTVYSLLHRGLERSRRLLQRRGVTIPAAALGTLLAGQHCVAAEIAWPAANVATMARGRAPSPTIDSLSNGAIRAMFRIHFYRRALLASAFLLIIGSSTLAVREVLGADVEPPLAAPARVAETTPPAAICPILMRLIDAERSRQRIAAGPYGRMLATPWGAALRKQLADEPKGRSVLELLAGLRSAGLSCRSDGQPRISADLVPGIGRDRLQAALSSAIAPLDLPAAQPGDTLSYQWPTRPTTGPVRSLPAALIDGAGDGSADAELCFSGVSYPMELLMQAAGIDGNPDLQRNTATMRAKEGKAIAWHQLSFRLEPFGLRERMVIHATEEGVKTMAENPGTLVTVDALAPLPAETLCAMAIGLTTYLNDKTTSDPDGAAAMEQLLSAYKLPPLAELRAGLKGATVLAMEAGAPLPAFNAWIGMDAALAGRLLAIADDRLGLIATGDVHDGFVGMAPVAATYRDGALVITTHPLGIPGITGRKPGFLAHPEIISALKEIPPGSANLIGLSRSGPSWSAIASLGAPMLAAQGQTGFATMPQDLGKIGTYGFCWSKRVDDTVITEAGGLFGGTTTMMLAGSTVFAAATGNTAALIGAVGMLGR